ncbi:amidase domain-containing protein [Peribacillus frigoritolerans]|uniref:amidase domain-containing protein n=1 Tax=Peribacillus frigoritolerans TaxID=450367 RepID=UPI001F4F5AF2|nr:amidase domain-containing protein [Peribacillus frigoritolerans]MCK2019363.1 amidase domain-containing protein [Peribacillus frigoritolerans]
MREQLQRLLQERVEFYTKDDLERGERKLHLKKKMLRNRAAEIVRVNAAGKVHSKRKEDRDTVLTYHVHLQYLLKQEDSFYIEEEMEEREARFRNGYIVDENELIPSFETEEAPPKCDPGADRLAYRYDRMKAVQYAERWWNEFNPAYYKFTDDCTNYISQCLHAGGIPMWGAPNKSKGWWIRGKSWSYTWTTAHSLYHLLKAGNAIRTKQVESAKELNLGDILCIDFEGDGRFDHNLIVTAKDQNGMPLVNAHTMNSRHRYWTYEDSTRYTSNIVYKFFVILDGG